MPDKLNNDMHIKAVLVMLPYDADKVTNTLNVGLQINGKPAGKLNLSDPAHIKGEIPLGATVSFLDADHKRVYFKLIADSDATVKPSQYSAGHDAAAFIQTDAKGVELTNKAGKPKIIVTFPGMNDPMHADLKDGMNDLMAATSYQETFFNKFIKQLAKSGVEHGVSLSDMEAVSHSMGDKFALEFAGRYGAKTMIIDGWDKTDAALGAAVRNVLRDHLGEQITDKQLDAELATKLKKISSVVTEINADGMQDFLTVVGPETRKAVFGDHTYKVKDAGHTAKFYVHRTEDDMIKVSSANLEAFTEAGIKSKEHYTGPFGHVLKMTPRVDHVFLASMENELGALKSVYMEDGNLSKNEKKSLQSFEQKIDAVREKLSMNGVGNAQVMAKAASEFLTPNEINAAAKAAVAQAAEDKPKRSNVPQR